MFSRLKLFAELFRKCASHTEWCDPNVYGRIGQCGAVVFVVGLVLIVAGIGHVKALLVFGGLLAGGLGWLVMWLAVGWDAREGQRPRRRQRPVVGYVYILKNRSLAHDMLKIGMTTRCPYERCTEISTATGVPTPFNLVYAAAVTSNARDAERRVHEALKHQRVRKAREFFRLDFENAREAIERSLGRDIRHDRTIVN